MSRVGRKPVAIPEKVSVETKGRTLTVKGPLGTLEQTLPLGVTVEIDGNTALVSKPKVNRQNAGYQGLVRALLANMVNGVTNGYEKTLEINGVGYKAELSGATLTCSLGFSHQKSITLPSGIKCVVGKNQTEIKISGIDRQLVGQVAAQIRSFKIPEPYKAKGVKYSTETIRRKEGKTGAK